MTFLLSHIRDLLRSREEIFQNAYEGRQFDAVYFAMLVFACLIALLGLLLNSPAIIIGAMLMSPLMGPILSCGLALTTADWDLGKKAGRNVVLSIVEVVLIAALATKLSPLRDVTPEILARTNPNLMDLLVAFFSGLAGTLALSSRKSGLSILPGVAIATAVMPPLATIGFGISTGQWAVARGAFMLFFTNFMAIVISAELVFLLVGFRPSRREVPEGTRLLMRYRTAIAFGVLVALSVPLLQTLIHAAQQVQLRQTLSSTLQAELKKTGRRLDGLNLQIGGDRVVVEAAVQTAKFIDVPQIKQWEDALSARAARPVRLDLQQLQLARKEEAIPPHPENRDFLAGGSIRPRSPEPQLSPADEVEKIQSKVEDSLRALLLPAGIDGFRIRSIGKQPDGSLLADVTGMEATPTDEAVWRVVAAATAREIDSPVRLTGSIVVSNATGVIKFRPNAVRPGRSELRDAERLVAQWKGRPALRYAFLATPPLDSTTTQRLAYLREKFPDAALHPIQRGPNNEQADQDSIRIQVFQVIDATSPNPTANAKVDSAVPVPESR